MSADVSEGPTKASGASREASEMLKPRLITAAEAAVLENVRAGLHRMEDGNYEHKEGATHPLLVSRPRTPIWHRVGRTFHESLPSPELVAWLSAGVMPKAASEVLLVDRKYISKAAQALKRQTKIFRRGHKDHVRNRTKPAEATAMLDALTAKVTSSLFLSLLSL